VLLERIRRIVGAQSVLYDPLPRSGGWPMILLLAAVGMLAALRLHAPPSVATALLNVPAQSVAAISGNPQLLVAAPVVAAASMPAATALHAADNAAARADTTTRPAPAAAASEPEIPIVPVARPKITVAAAVPAAPHAVDIREHIAAMPALAAPALPATTSEPALQMPIPLHRVQPDYPLHEKLGGVTGKVELQFAIDSDGSVREISVLESTPDHVFDRVAIAALKQWRFGTPADPAQLYTQSFAFALGGHAPATEGCHEVTGSHICRHVAAGEDPGTER
jgi:TonB family protein